MTDPPAPRAECGRDAGQPRPLRRSAFATGDPEVAAKFISDTYLDVDMRLSGPTDRFALRTGRWDPGPFQVDDVRLTMSPSFRYEPTDERLIVVRLRGGTVALRQPDVEVRLGVGDVALPVRPGVPSVAHASELDQQVVILAMSAIAAASAVDPDARRPPRFTAATPISGDAARRWQRAVDYVIGLVCDQSVAPGALVIAGAERLLASVALATFPNTAVAAVERIDARGATPQTVRRAVDFIEANADLDIGVVDVARAAHVTVRAVQLAFRRHLDTTPMAHLRRTRLARAHAQLLEATPGEGLTVTQVALRWGFANPSGFARHYRAQYGHAPSHTLDPDRAGGRDR